MTVRFLWLAILAGLVAGMMFVVGLDLIRQPRDIWVAATFCAGTLVGVALDRWQPRR